MRLVEVVEGELRGRRVSESQSRVKARKRTHLLDVEPGPVVVVLLVLPVALVLLGGGGEVGAGVQPNGRPRKLHVGRVVDDELLGELDVEDLHDGRVRSVRVRKTRKGGGTHEDDGGAVVDGPCDELEVLGPCDDADPDEALVDDEPDTDDLDVKLDDDEVVEELPVVEELDGGRPGPGALLVGPPDEDELLGGAEGEGVLEVDVLGEVGVVVGELVVVEEGETGPGEAADEVDVCGTDDGTGGVCDGRDDDVIVVVEEPGDELDAVDVIGGAELLDEAEVAEEPELEALLHEELRVNRWPRPL